MEVDDSIGMAKVDSDTPPLDPGVSMEIKRTAESLTVEKGDIVLLRGAWNQGMIEGMAKNLNDLDIHTLIVVLPTNDMGMESIPIKDFYSIMKECERRSGLAPHGDEGCTDGVSGD